MHMSGNYNGFPATQTIVLAYEDWAERLALDSGAAPSLKTPLPLGRDGHSPPPTRTLLTSQCREPLLTAADVFSCCHH